MSAKVTIVVDNGVPINSSKPFLGEHGLSMLLDIGGKRLLLDTGQTGSVVHNLGLLGVAPSSLDAIALSHGHYDHTGGLPQVLERAGKRLPVYLHEKAFGEKYSDSRGTRRFVGIPTRPERLAALGADFQWVREPLECLPGLWLSGSVPRVTVFETGDAHLVAPDAARGCDCQDPLEDDMALFCRPSRGLVVISGCTHSGLVNVVQHGLAVTGCQRLHGWIGGTHLGPVGEVQQAATLAQLADYAPDFVAANHCTGFAMMARLQAVFGERFVPAFVGTEIVFETE